VGETTLAKIEQKLTSPHLLTGIMRGFDRYAVNATSFA